MLSITTLAVGCAANTAEGRARQVQKDIVNWGIISTARIANTFAQDVRHCTNSKLYAVASRNIKDAKHFAHNHQIPNAYGSYTSMLEDPNIDAVYIATPHTLHCENAIQAMQAGKHVLCEKPATTSLPLLEHMIAEARAQDRFFMEAMWTYFLPAILKSKAWVESGEIGELLHIKASFGFPVHYEPKSREYAKELGGGCLLDMGIYPIALDALFNISEPTTEFVSHHLATNGVEDDVTWIYQRGQVTSTLHTSFRSRLNNDAWLIGSKGTIRIPDFWSAKECFLYDGNSLVEHFADAREGSGFEFEISHASDKILKGEKESSIVSHMVSRQLLKRLNDIRLNIEANGKDNS